MKNIIKKIEIIVLAFIICLINASLSFPANVAGQEMRTQVLFLADIIEDDNNLNDNVTRMELARMIVKASKYKDSVSDIDSQSAFSDVDSKSPYSAYIKIATREGYITAYLGGLYKPFEYVSYKDVIRACLSLLSYTNDDFKGNQINGRYNTFCSLRMNENIDRGINDLMTKKDCINAIYNTLKTSKKDSNSAYGPTVFDKLKINSDGNLNATGLIRTVLEGPFILKRGESLTNALPFDIREANIFMNGTSSSFEEISRELNIEGYVIYYYNKTTKTIYIYREGITMDSSTMVGKGFVNHIYYSASDTITPTKVEINLAEYSLANSDTKFAFSYAGTLHVGDQVIFIYTKTKTSDEEEDDSGMSTVGSITYACLYETRY